MPAPTQEQLEQQGYTKVVKNGKTYYTQKGKYTDIVSERGFPKRREREFTKQEYVFSDGKVEAITRDTRLTQRDQMQESYAPFVSEKIVYSDGRITQHHGWEDRGIGRGLGHTDYGAQEPVKLERPREGGAIIGEIEGAPVYRPPERVVHEPGKAPVVVEKLPGVKYKEKIYPSVKDVEKEVARKQAEITKKAAEERIKQREAVTGERVEIKPVEKVKVIEPTMATEFAKEWFEKQGREVTILPSGELIVKTKTGRKEVLDIEAIRLRMPKVQQKKLTDLQKLAGIKLQPPKPLTIGEKEELIPPRFLEKKIMRAEVPISAKVFPEFIPRVEKQVEKRRQEQLRKDLGKLAEPVPIKEKEPTIFKKIQEKFGVISEQREKEFKQVGTYLAVQKEQKKEIDKLLQYKVGLTYVGFKAFKGFATPFVHPIETGKGLYRMVRHPIKTFREQKELFIQEPIGFTAEMVGSLLAFKKIGEVVRPTAKFVKPKAIERVAPFIQRRKLVRVIKKKPITQLTAKEYKLLLKELKPIQPSPDVLIRSVVKVRRKVRRELKRPPRIEKLKVPEVPKQIKVIEGLKGEFIKKPFTEKQYKKLLLKRAERKPVSPEQLVKSLVSVQRKQRATIAKITKLSPETKLKGVPIKRLRVIEGLKGEFIKKTMTDKEYYKYLRKRIERKPTSPEQLIKGVVQLRRQQRKLMRKTLKIKRPKPVIPPKRLVVLEGLKGEFIKKPFTEKQYKQLLLKRAEKVVPSSDVLIKSLVTMQRQRRKAIKRMVRVERPELIQPPKRLVVLEGLKGEFIKKPFTEKQYKKLLLKRAKRFKQSPEQIIQSLAFAKRVARKRFLKQPIVRIEYPKVKPITIPKRVKPIIRERYIEKEIRVKGGEQVLLLKEPKLKQIQKRQRQITKQVQKEVRFPRQRLILLPPKQLVKPSIFPKIKTRFVLFQALKEELFKPQKVFIKSIIPRQARGLYPAIYLKPKQKTFVESLYKQMPKQIPKQAVEQLPKQIPKQIPEQIPSLPTETISLQIPKQIPKQEALQEQLVKSVELKPKLPRQILVIPFKRRKKKKKKKEIRKIVRPKPVYRPSLIGILYGKEYKFMGKKYKLARPIKELEKRILTGFGVRPVPLFKTKKKKKR